MKPLRSAALLFALLAAAIPLACSSSPPDAATACRDLLRAQCEQLSRCNSVEMQTLFANDINACVASEVSACKSISVKGLGFTPAVIEGCASAINAESCGQAASGKSPSACTPPPGTLGDGVACSTDEQCKGGLCFGAAPPSASTSGSCGTCTEKPSHVGCLTSSECPGDQICNFSTGVRQCVSPLAQGAVCGGAQSTPCQGGLICEQTNGSNGSTGICAPLPGAGGPCKYVGAYGCANGLVCNGTTCVAPTFVPLGRPCATPGLPSGGGVEICVGGACIQGTCVAYAAEGSACGTASTPSTAPACGAGLSCVNGKCASSFSAPLSCN